MKYFRADLKDFESYEVLEGEFALKLDANEGYERSDGLNRYPSDRANPLRVKLATMLGKTADEILLGNGSSELLDLIFKAYLQTGDGVVSFSPTFGLYRFYTRIHKGVYHDFPLEGLQKLDSERFINYVHEVGAKIVIICNPNNPTGCILPTEDVQKIIRMVDALVVLDQAYAEFSDYPLAPELDKMSNLIVLKTFSKALGLAGIRLGYMLSNPETINCIHKVRSPYNVNTLSQRMGLSALEGGLPAEFVQMIINERHRVAQALEELGFKPFPSQANFLFFAAAEQIYHGLRQRGILIRRFEGKLKGFYRVTLGTPEENNAFLRAIKEV